MEYLASSPEGTINLKQCWLIFKRHWLPASLTFLLVVTLSTLVGASKKPIYEAEGKLLIRKISSASSLTGVDQNTNELESVNRQGNPLETEMEVILSVPVIQNTITKLNLKDENGVPITPNQLGQQISVSQVGLGDILAVSYKDNDPEKAATVVNTLMEVYLQNNILINRTETSTARDFIERELPKAQANVEQAEADLRQFEAKHHISALEEELESIVKQTDGWQQQIVTAQSQLSDFSSELPIQELVKEIQQLQSQLALKQERFNDVNPTIIELKSQLTALKGSLQAKTQEVSRKKQQNLESQISTLSNLQAAYKQKLKILPVLKQEEKQLERQLERAQATYLQLQNKLKEIQLREKLTENQHFVNARVISPALVPDSSTVSFKSLYGGVGILLGSFLAGITVVILESRKRPLHESIRQLRQYFDVTVLGMIPAVENNTPMLPKLPYHDKSKQSSVSENPFVNFLNSPSAEAYQILQNNLSLMISTQNLKLIVVTSFLPQEGKSTVAANLALAMAQLGSNVLLVDANLRCPRQDQIWNLPNEFGLSEMILKAEYQRGITKVTDNIDIITSGVLPSNPIALLNSSSMADLIMEFDNNYDFVIFDTPCLNANADAFILGRMSDGILLVADARKFDPDLASFAKEGLGLSNQKIIGIVVNRT